MLRFAQSLPAPVAVSPEKRQSTPFRPRSILPRRFRGHFFGLLFLATIAFFFHYNRSSTSTSNSGDPDDLLSYLHGLPKPEGGSDPPRFYEWHDREKGLPQHNVNLPYPQGREAICGLGWGNAMQEMLFNAHLAYLSKRTYVFDNYTWDRTPGDFSKFADNKIPARVPLTALVSVCPTRTVIDRDKISGALGGASAATILQAWLEELERIEDRCVEIKDHTPQIFDFWLFGDSRRLLDIWPSLSTSPLLTHFSWSPLITAALSANAHVIHPALSSSTPSSFVPSSNPPPLSGLLALHIRRGDFIDHCEHLTNWSVRFMGFNEFPGLPDRFTPPKSSSDGYDDHYGYDLSAEERALYRAHCFPEIEQIVSRVREVRAALLRTTISRAPEWLRELKDALQEDARRERLNQWEHIGTSRDLRLTGEQRHNSQAMDMAVAQRAEVFIGNGFSSLSSNVGMLRAAQGRDWDTMRFW
ncbi:hypothetical protein BGY98DRAFT_979166 [Russula aff. rugulosa BPL654]|nr:hypothetical protein BGY98DRAFT_979166 [Russula aff. rugulosa BPL654]